MVIFGFLIRINTKSKSESKKCHTTANLTTAPRTYLLYCQTATIGDRQRAMSPFSLFSDDRPSVNLVKRRITQCGQNSVAVFLFTALVPSTAAVRTFITIRPIVNAILQTVLCFLEARESVACCQVPAVLGRPATRLLTQIPGTLRCTEKCRLTEL